MKAFKIGSDLSRHKDMPRAGQMCMRAAVAHIKAAIIGEDENSTANPGIDPTATNGNYNPSQVNPAAGGTATPKSVSRDSLVRAVWAAQIDPSSIQTYGGREDRWEQEKTIKSNLASSMTDAVADEVNSRLAACALVGRDMTEKAALELAIDVAQRRKDALRRFQSGEVPEWSKIAHAEGRTSTHEASHACADLILLDGIQVESISMAKGGNGGLTNFRSATNKVDHFCGLGMWVAGLAADPETTAADYHVAMPSDPKSDVHNSLRLAKAILQKAGHTAAAARIDPAKPDARALALVDELAAAFRVTFFKDERVCNAVDFIAQSLRNSHGYLQGDLVASAVGNALGGDHESVEKAKGEIRAAVTAGLRAALGC